MPTGLQIWNANGIEVFSPSKRISRFLGSFSTGAVNGSRSVSVPGGELFFFCVADELGVFSLPEVSVSGSQFSWVFQSMSVNGQQAPRRAYTIHYGVY